MAIGAGILGGTRVEARSLRSDNGFRRIALIWRRSSPRESEFQLLASTLRSEDGPGPGVVLPPAPRAQLVEARSPRQLALDPTQPRLVAPPIPASPASQPPSLRTFLLAVAVAFLVGVGLAFLMVMRR